MLHPIAHPSEDPMPPDPDHALLQAVAAGDERAIERLYARHGGAIFAFVLDLCRGDRAAAEDVLQDVMLAVWRGAASFRAESRVRTWLLAIAYRTALRDRPRATLVPFPTVHPRLVADTDVAAAAERRIRAAAVRRAIDDLPDALRTTVTLTFFHGLSDSEVAAVLDIPVGTVKSRLHRARALLRPVLSEADRPLEGSADGL